MSRHIRRMAAGLLCFTLLLAGCQVGNTNIMVSNPLGEKQLFKIGSTSCGIKEAKVYLVNYQNIYGYAYGLNLWQHDFGDTSLEDYVKNMTIGELARIVCMDQLAVTQGVELTEEEKGKVADAAEAYFSSLSGAEITYMDVSQNDICDYYEHYALAKKLYSFLTGGVNEEVSDDEARIMEIMQIYVTDEGKADEISERLAAGEDFASIANNYNELDAIQVTIGRDDVPDEVENVTFQLDNDEISDKITVDGGYYFIKCLNKYNQELTEANKVNIVEKREKEAFDDIYNEFVSTLSSSINQDLWRELEICTEPDIQTNRFFEIFENYCGDI